VLILEGVTGGLSTSADSKALAEMARAVSPFLVSLMDQRGFSLYTLSYYTILFIFVKRRMVLEPHLWATFLFPFWGVQIAQHGASQQGICAGLIAPALTPQPGDDVDVQAKRDLLL